MKRYPKVSKEQSYFFESASKATIFEILLDTMKCNYGDTEIDFHFLDILENENKKGTIQTPISDEISKTVRKARNLKNITEKVKK